VPVAVVSARLSPRSLAGYRRLGRPLRDLIAGLAGVVCQSEPDLERWRAAGARVETSAVGGNLKDDALRVGVPDRPAARAGLGLDAEAPLLVLGSLRPGEARLLARAWSRIPAGLRESWQVAAVPRHPRASRGLRREAAEAGVSVAERGAAGGAWSWDDRLGVLGQYYAAAEVAFVGGSLGPYGGHNPLEPAACGAALVMGRHHATQHDVVTALAAAGALRVVDGEADLATALRAWLEDAQARAKAEAAALAVVERRRGAARRTVALLEGWGLWPGA